MTQDIATSKPALHKAFSLQENFRSIYQRRASNYAPIDGIRALSILLVLVYHTFLVYDLSNPYETAASMTQHMGWAWTWAWNGDKGVDVFFVMSGFLITGILLKTYDKLGHLNLKNFYIRRYLRLTPAYYFMLTVYWLLMAHNSDMIWTNFLYVSNFIPAEHQAAGWTWSLAVEEQFYFIYPLILMAILKWAKSPGLILIALLWISILVNIVIVLTDNSLSTMPFSSVYVDDRYADHFFTILYDNLHTRFGGLVIGCLAAYAMQNHKVALTAVANTRLGIVLTMIGLSLIAFFMIYPAYLPGFDQPQIISVLYLILNHTLFAMGVGILILAMILQQHWIANGFRRFFSLAFWYPIASLSYSLYLIHLVVMTMVIPVLVKQTLTIPQVYPWTMGEVLLYSFIISSFISFVIAILMYLLIEKPILNLRR